MNRNNAKLLKLHLLVLAALACLAPAMFAQSNYKLRANDQIEVKVFQEEDLSVERLISRDGTVLLDLVGKVRVAGMSADDAADRIRRLYAEGYLVNPQVSVGVKTYSKRRFTVMGKVQKPVLYEIPENEEISLVQAIAMAGGFGKSANKKKVTIKRKVGGKMISKSFDVKSMSKAGASRQVKILEGDIVTVPESWF